MGFFDYFADFFRGTASPHRFLVTDVTRMAGDAVCIAAIGGAKAMRLSTPQPRDGWLESIGGLAPGDQISVAWRPEKRHKPPHVEDGRWAPDSLSKVGRLSGSDLVAALAPQACTSVIEAFGQPAFRSPGGNPAFAPGRGSRSLATLRARRTLVRPFGNGIRTDVVDDDGVWKMIPVEDLAIRTHRETCRECEGDGFAENLTDEFSRGEALIRIGLGRAFQSSSDARPGCYLQVNHVFPLNGAADSHFAVE